MLAFFLLVDTRSCVSLWRQFERISHVFLRERGLLIFKPTLAMMMVRVPVECLGLCAYAHGRGGHVHRDMTP